MPGGVGRAAIHDPSVPGDLGKAAGVAPPASRPRMSCTTARSSQAPRSFRRGNRPSASWERRPGRHRAPPQPVGFGEAGRRIRRRQFREPPGWSLSLLVFCPARALARRAFALFTLPVASRSMWWKPSPAAVPAALRRPRPWTRRSNRRWGCRADRPASTTGLQLCPKVVAERFHDGFGHEFADWVWFHCCL